MIARYLALCLACTVLAPHSASANSISRDFIAEMIAGLGSTLSVQGTGVVLDGAIYFAGEDPEHGTELWRTDGTPEGTWLVKDLHPGAAGGIPRAFFSATTGIYFQAADGVHGRELWRTDGTEAGTMLVKDIAEGLWSSFPMGFEELNGRVFFRAYEPTLGFELWGSDGTAVGTYLVKDIAAGIGNSSPSNLIAVNGALYFRAVNDAYGAELWRSDGTSEGTAILMDIVPGPASGSPSDLNPSSTVFYFRTPGAANEPQLWISDGTTGGTRVMDGIAGGQVKLSWQPPTQNSDGTPLVDLAGYRVRYGTSPWLLDGVIEITDPASTGHTLENFRPGPRYFAVGAVNSENIESVLSGVVFKFVL